MSSERTEHSMESEIEGISKRVYLYIGTTIPNLQKYEKKIWDSGIGTTLTGTGTTCTKSGSGHSVLVLPGDFGPN